MDEKLIRSTALFFYLNLFDSRLAYSAAQKALIDWRKIGLKIGDSEAWPRFIAVTTHVLSKIHRVKPADEEEAQGHWQIPEGVDLELWRKFKNNCDSKDFLAVLYSRVLDLSDEEIAQGLKLTTGTVRYRVQKGLKRLGGFL